jgi:hypothetical protein
MPEHKTWYLMNATKGENECAEFSGAFASEDEADAEAARLLLDQPGGAILLLEATKLFTASVVRETKRLRAAPVVAHHDAGFEP